MKRFWIITAAIVLLLWLALTNVLMPSPFQVFSRYVSPSVPRRDVQVFHVLQTKSPGGDTYLSFAIASNAFHRVVREGQFMQVGNRPAFGTNPPPNVPRWFKPAIYRTPVYARFTNKRWLFFFRSRYQTEFLWVDDTGTNGYYYRDITL